LHETLRAMKINSNKVFDQIIGLVDQLSEGEKEKLLNQIISGIHQKGSQNKIRSLILDAPTWSEDDFQDFKDARKHFNSSRLI
jgi:hypothetical protein